MSLTTTQIENVQIDYGIVYVNYGVLGERKLGPTRGGGEFKATLKIRDIEYDGAKGKTKGMQVVDSIAATLSVSVLDTSMDNIALALPQLTYASSVVTAKSENVGAIADSAYLTNITMFCKTMGGAYKKITLYNAMSESGFDLKAKAKGEGEVSLDVEAHWDPTDDTADLFKVEDVANISGDVTAPTVVTVPVDGAPSVVVSSNLTATFSEDIKQVDISTDNFMLIKATDGSIVAGAITYDLATKTATFNPTSDLAAGTDYLWAIARVRDLAGNTMLPIAVNFTTAT